MTTKEIEYQLVFLLDQSSRIRLSALTVLKASSLALPIQDIHSLAYSAPHVDMQAQQRCLDTLPIEPDALVSCLGTHDPILRHATAQRLVALGDVAHVPLLASLNRKRPFVATRAAAILGHLGAEEAALPIFTLWQDTSVHEEKLRDAYIAALATLLEKAPETPLTLLLEIIKATRSQEATQMASVSAAKCLTEQAEKYRTSEYRQALPLLKSSLNNYGPAQFGSFYFRVEKATKPQSNLPIPAESSPDSTNLPIPAEE